MFPHVLSLIEAKAPTVKIFVFRIACLTQLWTMIKLRPPSFPFKLRVMTGGEGERKYGISKYNKGNVATKYHVIVMTYSYQDSWQVGWRVR
jgi:hypothetical protein